MLAVALQHRDEIISLAATGLHISEIARRFNIQAPAISKHLADDPEYRAAREVAAEIRLEEREQNLETAPGTMSEISRASALLRQQQWRCEREFPHRWAARSHVTVEHKGELALKLRDGMDRLRALRESAVEGQVVSDPQQITHQESASPSTGIMSNDATLAMSHEHNATDSEPHE